MPKAFEEARKRGARVRTVTKGPNKGRLIAVGAGHPVLGHKRGHGARRLSRRGSSSAARRLTS